MPIPKSDKIWFNGRFVNWDDAKIHVMSHVVNYGSSVFEGIRCYNTKQGSAVFCLPQHVARLMNSAKIYRMDVPYSREQISQAILDTIRENRMKECYIRPVIFRSYGEIGVNPLGCPIDVVIAVWEWGKYLGKEALEQGVDQAGLAARPMSHDRDISNFRPPVLSHLLSPVHSGKGPDARGHLEPRAQRLFLHVSHPLRQLHGDRPARVSDLADTREDDGPTAFLVRRIDCAPPALEPIRKDALAARWAGD